MSSGSPSPVSHPGASLRDARAAVGARDESVERRRMRGGALRTIDPQVARDLVDLVLDHVERRDLDVGVDDAGRVRSDIQAVPRMRAPAGKIEVFHGRASVGTTSRHGESAGVYPHAHDKRRDHWLGQMPAPSRAQQRGPRHLPRHQRRLDPVSRTGIRERRVSHVPLGELELRGRGARAGLRRATTARRSSSSSSAPPVTTTRCPTWPPASSGASAPRAARPWT